MRYKQTNERRAVILMVVLAMLTLFAIVGITFVLYADAEAASARVAREAETQQRANVDPQQALAFFLSQLIYDVNDLPTLPNYNPGSGLRGHSLARTMYGYNNAAANLTAFDGVGRLHYASPLTYPAPPLANVPNNFANMLDDYALVNYTWFSSDPGGLNGAVRDPEHYGTRANPAVAQTNAYFGGNAPYTYPDLNNFYLAAVTANGTVLTPSFHRKWLFNPNNNFNDMSNPNWTNPQGKYLTLRPRPADHGNLFPAPDDPNGDVKNLVWAPGGNDSIWIDVGAPVMQAPDGTFYKMLFAPLIMDLDNRINLMTAGNILGPGNSHVSNMGLGGWEVNVGKVLYADNAATPTEWSNLLLGRLTGAGAQKILAKYGANGSPSTLNLSAVSGTFAHAYAPGDVNGLNETTPASASSRPAPPPTSGTPTYCFPSFAQGYLSGGTELLNHPLLYNIFRPPFYNANNLLTDDRVFLASDMEPLLRPNAFAGGPVDTNSSALASDLLRLCPTNFGPAQANLRFRNLVTTLSMDLGAPGVSPYWWTGMTSGYLTANANALLAPVAATVPTQGASVSFPPLPPAAGVTNVPGTSPPTSEFSSNWRALSANTQTYFPTTQPAVYTNPLWVWTAPNWVLSKVTTNPAGYTTPGARIRMNRPLPPYPHMGTGVTPPYAALAPATVTPYGVAYNMTVANIAQQYQAALNARQALANDLYRRLLAIAGVASPFINPANPGAPGAAQQDLSNLAARRWLAQLAVNMVDFLDEDDISTPFNFYTTADGLAAANLGATQGPDDPNANALDQSGQNATGANPLYWVFGTELPKVVLNEVLAEAQNPTVPLAAPPAGVTVNESVKLWVELYNTMPAAGGANTQPQDNYRVPLWVSNPASGVAAGVASGYSPYRITISQWLMNQNFLPNPPVGLAGVLPDASANVLGKGYVASPPFPQSTTDSDFCPATIGAAGVQLSQDLANPAPNPLVYQVTPAPGTAVTAGVDPSNYFLIGPKTIPANPNTNIKNPPPPYQNPFAFPSFLPPNIPVLQTDSLSYVPTWAANPAATTDERTTGLTVMLRRLANPYLPFNGSPTIPDPNLVGNFIPNPVYNPYVTVDYIQNVPIQNNSGLLQNPVVNPVYQSWGKRQPYTSFVQPGQASSPVAAQLAAAVAPMAAGVTTNSVVNTYGYGNNPPPPSGHYDWLVHLDRPAISPMELLHVSAWPPYMLTQRFMLGPDNTPATMFGHYAPWLDYPPGGNAAAMASPWWYDSTGLTAATQSHRLYRLFEFLESGDWATGVNALGRIPGKVNINTIWDPETLQALVDANMSMGLPALPSAYPPTTTGPPSNLLVDPVVQIFMNMIQSRSPNALYNPTTGTYGGTIGAVNMGTGNDDRPFLPLSAGLSAAGPGTQYPNGISVTTDTLLRTNNPFAKAATYPPPQPAANQWLLFQNYTDTALATHPYLQTQLLTKLYNKVTTRSNTFAVFVTVGFFQVTNPTATPPTLGAEIGRSEGRQIRHRMFAIVDRTNLSAFTTTSSSAVAVPTVVNPTGQATITLGSGLPAYFKPGMQLVLEPGTANEETIVVQAVTGTNITANFTKAHPNPAVSGSAATTYQIILRGNPGPQTNYDPRNDSLVVPYFSIID